VRPPRTARRRRGDAPSSPGAPGEEGSAIGRAWDAPSTGFPGRRGTWEPATRRPALLIACLLLLATGLALLALGAALTEPGTGSPPAVAAEGASVELLRVVDGRVAERWALDADGAYWRATPTVAPPVVVFVTVPPLLLTIPTDYLPLFWTPAAIPPGTPAPVTSGRPAGAS
jgi:hypothetical protein